MDQAHDPSDVPAPCALEHVSDTSNALSADPKWKKYTSLVDKSLASFDSVKEWADFISFLSRLLRTLQANPSFDEIPRKLVVAKRLAQCLTPALPSGVHQRALDVYGHILKTIKVRARSTCTLSLACALTTPLSPQLAA